MEKRTLLAFLMLVTSPLVLLVNAWTVRSPILGTIASLVFFFIASWVTGELLYSREDRVFRVTFGFITILMFLALTGNVLIVIASFTEIVSLVAITVLNVVLGLFFVRFRRGHSLQVIGESRVGHGKKVVGEAILFLIPFLFSAVVAFRLLWLGRTGEGGASVWLTIPSFFVPLFLVVSFSLMGILVFTSLSNSFKLGLVCVYSFLAHSLFLLVWYPGRFGDPWAHLGSARYIARTGMTYAYSRLVEQFLIVDLAVKVQQALTVFFGRMFSVDLYWVHVVLVPLLWSTLVPLIAYRIAEMLTVNKSRIFPILTAAATLLFPSLIIWGTVSVPNSLGFVFFFVSVLFLLLWMNHGEKRMLVMSLSASTVSFLAHPQTGLFAFMLLLWGIVIKKTTRKIWRFASYVPLFMVYPLALLYWKASLSLSGLLVLDNFLSFQSEISTILLVFGIVGLVFGVRSRLVNTRSAVMFFVLYATILSEYYLTNFGMTGLPYWAGRILTMADFLLVPFVALGFFMIARAFGKGSSWRSRAWSSVDISLERFKFDLSGRYVGLLLVCLFLSLQTTFALYQAYPRSEIVVVQPAAYGLEAIQFIDSNSPERYVVLCHPGFSGLAIGFLGVDYGWGGNPRGYFGISSFGYPIAQMYGEMTKTPSIGIMQQGMNFANAKLSYFVVSVRDPKFEEIVERTLEILPAIRVFGDGKLYVFMYPLPVFEEPGSVVKVIFDDGTGEQSVQTTFAYMVESGINSTLTLSGYRSYNVTGFPTHWTFLELTVNNVSRGFDDSSDINTFVYVKGLQPSDVLTIKWLFNRHYPNVGWKEDSFKRLDKWRRHDLYPGTMVPTITTDGDILRMSYSFTSGFYWYYYYVTSVNVSTEDYPYLLMRWRSDRPVAVASVTFELGGGQEMVPFGSLSPEWSTIVVPLPLGAIVRTVMVGLSNGRYAPDYAISGTGTLEVDYILFVAKATP